MARAGSREGHKAARARAISGVRRSQQLGCSHRKGALLRVRGARWEGEHRGEGVGAQEDAHIRPARPGTACSRKARSPQPTAKDSSTGIVR